MNALDWHKAEKAVELLCELDAVERQSDFCVGQGWASAAQGHCDRAQEIEDEIDTLRAEAVDAFADAHGPRESDPWWDAMEEADSEATTLKEATDFARRERWGNRLLERAA